MKIKLKFLIKAYAINKNNPKKFKCSKFYNENLTLNDILKDIYQNYSQDNMSQEELEPFGYCALICEPNLFEINYKFVGLFPEQGIYEYKNIPIVDLEKQFNITQKQFEIWLDLCVGNAVGRCIGIHFFFHTKEKDIHHRPHIHCKYGSEEFRVDLNELKILDEPFKSKKRTKKALEMIKINQQELKKYWDNVVVNGEKVKFKMYLPN